MERISVLAEDILLEEIDKPLSERNVELIDALNGSILLQNELNYQISVTAGRLGLETSGYSLRTAVDENGNILGFVLA